MIFIQTLVSLLPMMTWSAMLLQTTSCSSSSQKKPENRSAIPEIEPPADAELPPLVDLLSDKESEAHLKKIETCKQRSVAEGLTSSDVKAMTANYWGESDVVEKNEDYKKFLQFTERESMTVLAKMFSEPDVGEPLAVYYGTYNDNQFFHSSTGQKLKAKCNEVMDKRVYEPFSFDDPMRKEKKAKQDAINAKVELEAQKYCWVNSIIGGADDGSGFRVVYARNIVHATGEKLLAVLITFWDFDLALGTMKLREGYSSMRMRLQLPSALSEVAGDKVFIALPLESTLGDAGSLAKLQMFTALDPETGKEVDVELSAKSPGISPLIPRNGSHGCYFCHSTESIFRQGPGIDKTKVASAFNLKDDDAVNNYLIDNGSRLSIGLEFVESYEQPEKNSSVIELMRVVDAYAQDGAMTQNLLRIEAFKNPKELFKIDGLADVALRRCAEID